VEGPVYNRLRRVTRDATIAGWEVKAESLVDCVIGAANLDASVFPDPTRFDIHRRFARHLAFGGGIHQCLGAPLARMEARIVFEELLALGHAGAEYDAWLIRIDEGDQFGSGFVAANPNSKIPALVDRSGPEPVRVFESGAILMHLAETFDALLPEAGAARAECLSWLFWQMGSAPYLGGGFGHFYAYAPTKIEYAIDRFAMETKRQLDVLDRRLAESEYLGGADYTIADIAVWPWYGGLVKGLLYGSGEFLSVHEYTHVLRWADQIGARPAVRRGRIVNRVMGDPATQLRERHEASDFDTNTQDKVEARAAATSGGGG
jgi:GST-like protein